MLIVKTIESKEADDNVGAYIDARIRSKDAVTKYSEFFLNRDHKAKVDEVSSIIKNFFKVHNGIYVTQRSNRGNPFTAIKVNRPVFPNGMPNSLKTTTYYKPLEDLGVEVIYAAGTNSWIYRVR